MHDSVHVHENMKMSADSSTILYVNNSYIFSIKRHSPNERWVQVNASSETEVAFILGTVVVLCLMF